MSTKSEAKVDKRSKAYRAAHKNDTVHAPKIITERLTKSLGKPETEPSVSPSITMTIKDLQKQVDNCNKRKSQLETKVG